MTPERIIGLIDSYRRTLEPYPRTSKQVMDRDHWNSFSAHFSQAYKSIYDHTLKHSLSKSKYPYPNSHYEPLTTKSCI